MSKKTSEPSIPAEIMEKIQQLEHTLDIASDLYDQIFDWYDQELKSYDASANASDELFAPESGTIVPYISQLAILEGLSIVQTFNETYPDA